MRPAIAGEPTALLSDMAGLPCATSNRLTCVVTIAAPRAQRASYPAGLMLALRWKTLPGS